MALYNGDHTYNGKPLFRAAIMDSGTIVPADPVDCAKSQVVYDTVVKNAGCAGVTDTLACLRGLDYTTFLNAGKLYLHSISDCWNSARKIHESSTYIYKY